MDLKGVYISKTKEYPFDLVSTGDYVNPITEVFRLKDSQTTLIKDIPLYLVVANVNVEYIKVKIVGRMTTIRYFLSKDGYDWNNDSITFENEINTLDRYVVLPFYLRIAVDDFIELYNLKNQSSITTYKLQVVWV
jgi:hypothetical protein